MEFETLVKERYSCKNYSEKKVEADKLEKALDLVRLAPTAKNLQEQHIYIIQSADLLKKIDEITPCRYGASTVICVAFNMRNVYIYPGEKRDSGIEDASIVATHLMLACKNEGLETCWINCFDPEKAKKLLNLPDNEEILMLLDVGYPGVNGKPLPNHSLRKDIKDTVTFL